MKPGVILAGIAALAVMAGMLVFVLNPAWMEKGGATDAYAAPGLDPMTFPQAQGEFYRLAPALLLVVYDAFGRTGEEDIYDTLANVAHGDALEQLYLERIGAMKGGGLDEADQTIHEINLLSTNVVAKDGALVFDASWQVIGTVGHAEHLHVRGNTYRANLTVAPVDKAWKIINFQLLDVNRDAAGETFEVSEDKQ